VTRIGVLGGTFDPIHVGHIDVAEAARRALHLDQVLVMPSHVPPHRQPPRASAAHRFAMAALAVAGRPGLVVSDLEMESDGPSYTAATLDRFVARGVDTTGLFFVTGADAFREIETWMDYPRILDRCHFVVVSRPGSPASSLRVALPSLSDRMIKAPGAAPARPGIFLIDAPTAPVSSTEVRRRAEAGASIEGLVPAAVAAHIAAHRLYAARGEGRTSES
jgi:nicotinate-nucleotide adenylyltransferase